MPTPHEEGLLGVSRFVRLNQQRSRFPQSLGIQMDLKERIQEWRRLVQSSPSEWESDRLGLIEFAISHRFKTLEELAKECNRDESWCYDKLHLFKLTPLAEEARKRKLIMLNNAILLAMLRGEDQDQFVGAAIHMPMNQFDVTLYRFQRDRVRKVSLPVLTHEEYVSDLAKHNAILIQEIKRLRCELKAAEESYRNLRRATRQRTWWDD